MWPFRKDERDAEIRRLRQALDQADDAAESAFQQRNEAVAALEAVQKAATPVGLADLASAASREIANVYAQGHGSVRHRDSAVWAVVHHALSRATSGRPAWNTAALARAAIEERGDG